MGNIHFFEILDFFLGWAGYDVCGDDYATWLASQAAGTQPPEAAPSAPAVDPPPAPPPKPPKKPPRKSRPIPSKIDIGPLDAQP